MKKLAVIAGITAASYFITKEIQTATNTFVIDEKDIELETLSQKHDGLRIAHLSDIHNQFFFKSDEDYAFAVDKTFRSNLAESLSKRNPDIIVISGDLFDKRRPHIGQGLEFLSELSTIAPVYVVSGNHDKTAIDGKESLRNLTHEKLVEIGVHPLDNSFEFLDKDLALIGIEDPLHTNEHDWNEGLTELVSRVREKGAQTIILLSHRPERFYSYAQNAIDLSLCGHAHGGQVQAPLLGALFAPHQGYFPHYTDGVYTLINPANSAGPKLSHMHLSRGIGSTNLEFRFLSQAHASILTLRTVHLAKE